MHFWASIDPPELLSAIQSALEAQGVRAVRAGNGPYNALRFRIGGSDHRRVPFRGWVDVETLSTSDPSVRSFCNMQRDEVTKLFAFTNVIC
jgi:serine/threonine-protein kinase Chk1